MKTTKILCIVTTFFLFSAQELCGSPNIILFGFPGSGKGTLSQKIIEKYQYAHICPGNLLRAEVRNKTDFGKEIKPITDEGGYVPEQDLFAFLKNKIMEAHNENLPIIFDGYPRSTEAFKLLDSLLRELSIKENTIALHLNIDKEKLAERVLNRAVCNKCNEVYTQKIEECGTCQVKLDKRPQDTPEILEKRIGHYMQIEKPLLQSFADHGYQVLDIDAGNDPEEIFKHVCKLIEKQSAEEHAEPRLLRKNVSAAPEKLEDVTENR